jgi:hypothetical protein
LTQRKETSSDAAPVSLKEWPMKEEKDYFFISFLGNRTQSPNRPMKAAPAAMISIFQQLPAITLI